MTIDVLVVDDSPLMQRIITRLLQSDSRIRVIDTASDGVEALDKVKRHRPDVVTLDIEMPRMDGLEALGHILREAPTPIVMLSGLQEADFAVRALQLGAVEFVAKPSGTLSIDLYKVREELIQKVKMATMVNLERTLSDRKTLTSSSVESSDSPARRPVAAGDPEYLVVIGASTGGPRALRQIVSALPGDLPAAFLIVQHMPAGFTKSFSERLNKHSPLRVVEAEEGEVVKMGHGYVAPGGVHLTVVAEGSRCRLRLLETPPVNGVRPSVDVLMNSVAQARGDKAIGILLTGMGADGTDGLTAIHTSGGVTIAQNRETSAVFGMPRSAIRAGVVARVRSLDAIPSAIVDSIERSP